MNWKGYTFCIVMLIVALSAWLRPTLPAAAADPPRKFEYMLIPATDASSSVSQLNTAGANGWRAVGLLCLNMSAGNSGFGCGPETLLVREAP